MGVEINWAAVIFATLAAMAVGAAWYAPPVFGNAWMRLAKVDRKKSTQRPIRPLAIAALVSLTTAYVLAHVTFLAHSFLITRTYRTR